MLTIYGIPAFSYFIYEIVNKDFVTVVSKTGHLKWDWLDLKGNKQILFMSWLFFLFFSKYFISMGQTGVIPSWIAVWGLNILFIPVAWLFYRFAQK
jgi:hypothetical protein